MAIESAHGPRAAAARWFRWAAAGLVLLGALRIVATYDELSETVDEVAHIGAGMEWLALHRYTFELQHPPLARIVAGLGPYLLGIRAQHQPNLWDEGRRVLYADGEYVRNLTAARLGMLPFFLLAAFFVWRIARDSFGAATALGAVACFTLLPPVLAHFGLATTDGPFVALFAGATYALVRWLGRPTVASGVGLGVAGGLALVTKFSSIPYLGALAVSLVAARVWSARARASVPSADTLGTDAAGHGVTAQPGWSWPQAAVSLALAALAGSLAAWAVYRFSFGTVRGIPMPAPEIPKGIREVMEHNRYGHPAYFLGDVRAHGVWYFFPVMLALKTPLAALALGTAGSVLLALRAQRTRDWVPLVPPLAAVAILVPAMMAHINIGVRHVLPIYVSLALAAAVGWVWAWHRWAGRRSRAALIGTTAVFSFSTFTIHPDYLAYFNALAGRDPSRLVADSDLDWGQDMFRLARAVREQGIDSLTFAYLGTGHLAQIIGVPVTFWDGNGRPSGWVAVSETVFRRGLITFRRGAYQSREDAFFWLDSAATFTRVGKGIRLYQVPAGTAPEPAARPALVPSMTERGRSREGLFVLAARAAVKLPIRPGQSPLRRADVWSRLRPLPRPRGAHRATHRRARRH